MTPSAEVCGDAEHQGGGGTLDYSWFWCLKTSGWLLLIIGGFWMGIINS